MKKNPWIGLVPLIDPEKESLWMLPGYMEGVLAAGGVPVMLPLTQERAVISELADRLDGLIFTGGHDVSPSVYGEGPLPQCGRFLPERDEMEKLLLDAALERNLPVLGICRGLQFMNAALGGTLYQDLPTQHPSEVEHEMKPPFDRAAHEVTVLADTPLAQILGNGVLGVNSRHHQAVKELAPCLKPMAISPDGLIEAAYLPGKSFVLGVQWHPEHFFKKDDGCLALFQALVAAAARQ
ncbi:MAG TPA: gamma-glutamyl-gamma-aminobutyrate hydrolase family protein [Candidatus Eisenbergiella merdipullorum]|uniref:Gamma-glutamyl-gamma-aminobutyrate hydrolase family protein n=1 Tax=Candidatus Eisenbergiella merdipullorum TaxID=2838553 RepID=A0A9D2L0T9_9FIRM|nr:gamma-glutamyl-gamma-aminobutyrate hydrolase family protein [Candidatus Eisenbergiella merdipullorum]